MLGGGAVLAFVGLWNFYIHSRRIKHANLHDESLHDNSHADILYYSHVTSGDQIIRTYNWPITGRLYLCSCIHNPRYDPLFCISFRINNLLTWNGFIFQTGSTFQSKHNPHIFVSTYKQGYSRIDFKIPVVSRGFRVYLKKEIKGRAYKVFIRVCTKKWLFWILKMPGPENKDELGCLINKGSCCKMGSKWPVPVRPVSKWPILG